MAIIFSVVPPIRIVATIRVINIGSTNKFCYIFQPSDVWRCKDKRAIGFEYALNFPEYFARII